MKTGKDCVTTIAFDVGPLKRLLNSAIKRMEKIERPFVRKSDLAAIIDKRVAKALRRRRIEESK